MPAFAVEMPHVPLTVLETATKRAERHEVVPVVPLLVVVDMERVAAVGGLEEVAVVHILPKPGRPKRVTALLPRNVAIIYDELDG